MTLNKLTFIILELNSALDTGKYDDLSLSEASHHIDARAVLPWLESRVPEMDLSILSEEDADEYQAGLTDIFGGYAGAERRKWGVEHRGLCLLIAWTNELVQRRVFSD